MSLRKEIYQHILTACTQPSIHAPLEPAKKLSKTFNRPIYLKREDLQPIFSLKCRGACHKLWLLSKDPSIKKVMTASAGNHAQGLALGAQFYHLDALIVMPRTTPFIKIKAVQNLGATVEIIGDSYDEAYAYAIDKSRSENIPFIPAFDDKEIAAGQGTVAKEIDADIDLNTIEAIFVPVGGGGLFGGMVAYLSQTYPHVRIIGVEHEGSACLKEALLAHERVCLPRVDLFADGVAVKQIGQVAFDLVNELPNEA